MGWFDEQIRQRKRASESAFEDSFVEITEAVTGNRIYASLNDDRKLAEDSIGEILRFYKIKSREVPETLTDINEVLEYQLRPHGIMRRNVKLEKGWYKDAAGAMIGTRSDDGSIVALIPDSLFGYRFFDKNKGKYVRVGRRNETLIDKDAVAFYVPLPLKKMSIVSLADFIRQQLVPSDVLWLILSTLAVTLVGMILPKLHKTLLSTVLDSKSVSMLWGITVFMICASLSSTMLTIIKSLVTSRITTGLSLKVEAASMMRVLSLPTGFFKEFSSGELSNRMEYIEALASQIIETALSTGLTGLFSLLYIVQIFDYAPALVVPSIIVTIVTLAASLITMLMQIKVSRQLMELSAKESGITHALIGGVQKIRLSGAEQRAFAKWGSAYAKTAKLSYSPPLFLKISPVINTAIPLIGTIVIYFMATESGVTPSEYYAFNTAYGMVSGAFLALASIATTVAQIKPTLEMVKPILEAVPEIDEEKEMITQLSGSVELSNITFSYGESLPNVIDNLSLKIDPGQYVAIVGKTGCGKSTLMRILLGFEKPQKGAVYYDGKDLSTLDPKSLRRRIGSVMQDGKLFMGDIYSNIVITAPQLTLDDAWAAAETACIADDIRQMPMGMFTLISEGSGGISGGQKQRLMIARAIAPKPKILIFDEATSALDNITQKKISEALDGMKCTRIVIAHRLSTIRQCDRIVMIEDGHIIEDGTYEGLLSKNGKFAALVARQRLDTE